MSRGSSRRLAARSDRQALVAVGAFAAVVAVSVLAAGCSDPEFEPPSRAERVADADRRFDPALFDSIDWPEQSERMLAGNAVYAAECRRCHGPLGRGDTEYARANHLAVPSLVEPDWDLADDPIALRRAIYIGHEAGMPTWGVAGITVREIDAVAAYLAEDLRPELLTGSEP